MRDCCGEDRPAGGEGLQGIAAAILVGGLGMRLREVVGDRPKVLAEVCGRPFLAYLLDFLVEQGLQKVVLCTGYMGHQVRQEFGDTFRGMALDYSEESEPLGTGGALRLALPLLGDADVLVMNGDSYCQADLDDFARFHSGLCQLPHASLVVVEAEDTRQFGRVLFNEQGRTTVFQEKGASVGSGWINAGIYLLSSALVREIPEGRLVSLEKQMFPMWVEHRMFAWRSGGPFIDIGTAQSYADAEAFFGAAP